MYYPEKWENQEREEENATQKYFKYYKWKSTLAHLRAEITRFNIQK